MEHLFTDSWSGLYLTHQLNKIHVRPEVFVLSNVQTLHLNDI